MGKIIALIFVLFGTVMSILCFFYGIRKIANGEKSFQIMKLLKSMNEFKGTLNDFSGSEILAVGAFLLLATSLFFYFIFLKA